MPSIRRLTQFLAQHADHEHCLFMLRDLSVLFPALDHAAFTALLGRAVRMGYLIRICRGLYGYRSAMPQDGLVLFHAAAILRASAFNYISLETALSDVGVISQIPMNWITIMSSGRSSVVSCGAFGTIAFVHTGQKPADIAAELSYDANCRLWRASVPQALRDMKATRRNCDLINWNIAHEFI